MGSIFHSMKKFQCWRPYKDAALILRAGSETSIKATGSITFFFISIANPFFILNEELSKRNIGYTETMALLIREVSSFDPLEWWDKGSGGAEDGSFWAAMVPNGYYALGSMGTKGYRNSVTGGVHFIVVRAGSDHDAVRHPVDYDLIWKDRGSGADLDGSMWLPIPPPGYVALGVVANRGYGKPSRNEIVCVKREYTVPGRAGLPVWNDRKTGSDHDFGAWLIADAADDKKGIPVGTFVGVTSHSAPASSPLLHVLSSEYVGGPSPPTFHELNILIRKYGPLYRIHPHELYRPTSVEWFVPRCTLVNNTTGEKRTGITAASLPTDGTHYSLEINDPSTYRGDFSVAKAYVHAKAVNAATTDIQFWFFYAYNGHGTARVKTFTFGGASLHSGNASLQPLGAHQGDWEHITIRFNNFSHLPEYVYMAQHSGGVWLPWGDVEKLGEQVIVYSSLNGHASYPHTGENYSEHKKIPDTNWTPLGLDFKLRNDTAAGPVVLDSAKSFQIIDANYLKGAAPPVPHWVNFRGRYGKKEGVHLSNHAINSILRAVLGPFLSVAANATIIGTLAHTLVPVFTKDEDGPTAPIQKREWEGEEDTE